MQDVTISGDKENYSKGSILVSSYFSELKSNNLVNSHMEKQLERVEFNKKMVIPSLLFGAGVANFIINPLFLSRTSRVLRKVVVAWVCFSVFQRRVTTINSLEESIFIENFDYFPSYFHDYLRTKDHRYLLDAKFDVNDYDPVTKMPLPGK